MDFKEVLGWFSPWAAGVGVNVTRVYSRDDLSYRSIMRQSRFEVKRVFDRPVI